MTLKEQRILCLPLLFSGDQLFSHIQLQKILENSNRELRKATNPKMIGSSNYCISIYGIHLSNKMTLIEHKIGVHEVIHHSWLVKPISLWDVR